MTDSVSTMTTTLDGSGVAHGARVITKSMLDIIHGTRGAQTALAALDSQASRFGRGGTAAMNALHGGVTHVNKATTGLRHTLKTIEDRIIRIGATIAVFASIAGTMRLIGGAFQEAFEYLSLMETAMLGIASSYLVVGNYVDQTTKKQLDAQSAFVMAQQDSVKAVEMLKVANLKTIATLDELVQGFQIALPVALRQGFDTKQVVDFTTAVYQMAGAIGQPFDQMSEEIRSLLGQANITKHSRMAQILGLQAGTAIRKEFDKAKAAGADLYPFLMKLMKPFEMAGRASQETWDGLISNIKDIGKIGLGLAFDKMFDAAKNTLMEIQGIFGTINNETLSFDFNPEFLSIAREVGNVLKQAFTEVKEAITSNLNTGALSTLLTELKLIGGLMFGVAKAFISAIVPITATITAFVSFRIILASIKGTYALFNAAVNASTVAYSNNELALARLGVTKAASQTQTQRTLVLKNQEIAATVAKITAEQREMAQIAAKLAMERMHGEAIMMNVRATLASATATEWNTKVKSDALARTALLAKGEAHRAAMALAAAEANVAAAKKELFTRVMNNETIAAKAAALKVEAAANARNTAAINASTAATAAATAANEAAVAATQARATAAANVVRAQILMIKTDQAAVLAAERHNAALLRQGRTTGFVSAQMLRSNQITFLKASADQRATMIAKAHEAALLGQARALTLAGVAAKAAAGAMSALRGVFTLLGGWFTLITVAIMGAMWAWEKYGNAAEKAQEKVNANLEGIRNTTKQLLEQAKQLDKARIAKENYDKAIAGGATHEQATKSVGFLAMTEANLGTNLPEWDRLNKEKWELEQKIAEAENKIKNTPISTMGIHAELNSAAEEKLASLRKQHKDIAYALLELQTAANIVAEKTAGIDHVTTPNAGADEKDKYDKLAKARLSLVKKENMLLIAGDEERAKIVMTIESDRYNNHLIAAEEYHRSVQRMEEDQLQRQIDATRASLSEAQSNKLLSGTPSDTDGIIDQIKAREQVVELEINLAKLIAERKGIAVSADIAIANSAKEAASSYEGYANAITNLIGTNVEKQKVEEFSIAQQDELLKLTTEMEAATKRKDYVAAAGARKAIDDIKELLLYKKELSAIDDKNAISAAQISTIRGIEGERAAIALRYDTEIEKLQLMIDMKRKAFGGAADTSVEEAQIGAAKVNKEYDIKMTSPWEQWLEDARMNLETFDQLAADTASNFVNLFSSAFEGWATGAKTAKEAFYDLASGMASSMISALAQIAAQWMVTQIAQMVMGKTAQSAQVGAAAAAGPAIAAAYAPAAAMVSLASFGANSAPATAGIITTNLVAMAMAAMGAGAGAAGGMVGMAHDGVDKVPETGSWLLEKGERVTTENTSAKLDKTLELILAQQNNQGQGGNGAPQNIRIVNAFDSSIVGDYLGSDAGERKIMNVIKNNPSAIKQITG